MQHAAHDYQGRIERLIPGVQLIRTYQLKWLRADLLAGVTVVAILIPQALAYGQLAGVAPVAGLYTAVVAMLIYPLFATSPQLMVGPDSGSAILVAATIAPLAGGNPARAAALAALLAAMVGLLLIGGGLARLGFIADYLSKPILIGYINGSALIIVASQLGGLFGIKLTNGAFFPRIWELISQLNEIHWLTLGIGLALIVLVVALRLISRKIPAALVAVIVATLAATIFPLAVHGVTVVGEVPAGLPTLEVPVSSLGEFGALLPGAVGLALVIFADTILTGRAFAAKNGYEIDAGQELVAVGAANFSAGLFHGITGSTSQSRTVVNDQAGGKTQLTSIICALLVAVFLVFLSPLLRNLPQVTLAAIILVAAISLIDVQSLRNLY
ncbi:MAG: SulP family inorganic anion transporter, partial [Ktedonobacterales bacterium]